MVQKFEGLEAGLASIDAVLNEQAMNARDASDVRNGFDPSKTYSPDEIKKLGFSGVLALKNSGKESKYLVLKIRLEGEGSQFGKLCLRGFDRPIDAHPALADQFLCRELQPVVSPFFEIPEGWPYVREGTNDKYAPSIARENERLKLIVSAIGGGKFDLKNNGINLRGSSMAFGSIPQAYQDKFRNLLEQLVQKPAYNGFQINFG